MNEPAQPAPAPRRFAARLRRASLSPESAAGRERWRRTLALTATLLAFWVLVTFVVSFHARELSFDFFGWPFSFWMAAQGAPLVYLALVCLYAWRANRFEPDDTP